jgi:hypothetical protein
MIATLAGIIFLFGTARQLDRGSTGVSLISASLSGFGVYQGWGNACQSSASTASIKYRKS